MKVRAFGDVQVGTAAAPAAVVNARQRRILAALLLAGPGGLSVDQLATRVWDPDEEPSSPVPTLRTYVKRLRTVARDPDGDLLVTRPGGYALAVTDDETDVGSFATAATQALRSLDPDEAAAHAEDALALWRGPPFPGLEHLDWVEPEVVRLRELLVSVQELRLELHLDQDIGDVAAEAGALLLEHPYRERLLALRALALYRSGRQADALADIAEHRRRLADDLGVEVSPEVRDLEVAILRQAPELNGPRRRGRRLRGYRLGARIGMGAHSVVYRAHQPSVGREVAIKVVRRELANDPAFVRRFATEAQTVARLSHPHVVPLHDYWREADQAYLVMRWVEGGSLADALRRGPLEVGRAARVVGQVAGALDFAHRRGVVHRDVKPSNVLLDADDNAYLGDFGIALVDGPDEEVPSLRAVGSPTFAAPEQFEDPVVGPAADVYALGVLVYVVLSGRAPWPDATDTLTLSRRHRSEPLPPLETGSPGVDAAVDAVIARATAKSPGDRYPTAGALAADLAAAASSAPLPLTADVVNPYLGLAAFGEPDAARFFGRESLVRRVVDRLRSDAGVLLVGPSGCGKSSLVHAGVVPRLRAAEDGPVVTTMVPGADPVDALVQAVRMVATEPGADVAELLARGVGVAEVARAACPGTRVVLVVDQLEELFTQGDPERTEEFLAVLARGMETAGDDVRFLLTVRADFFDRPLESRAFGGHVGDTVEPVQPMTADELVAAIVEPARAVGVAFTEPLLARLVVDGSGGPGRLPLLQFALTRMFEHRSGDRIDLADYERVGGIAGALADAAEQRFSALAEPDRDAVHRLMSRLVVVEDEVTRRREPRAEVEAVSGVSPALVDLLVDDRLLTLDRQPASREPTVELVHEALLDAWPRLRGWVEQDRAALAALSRLHGDAAAWEAQARDPESLYRGGRLEAAEALVGHAGVGVSAVERRFVEASRRQVREEERAALRAEAEEKGRRRRRRLLVGGAAAVLVTGLVASVLGVAAAGSAAREQEVAAQTELIGRSRSLQDTRTDLALLLAAEAYTRDAGAESQGALLGALRRMRGTAEVWTGPRYDIGTSQAYCVNTTEPGVWVVQPNTDSPSDPSSGGELLRVDVVAREVTRIEDQPLECDVRGAGASRPDGPRYAAETPGGAVVVLAADGAEVASLPGWSSPLFGPDGELIARRGLDDTLAPFFVIDLATRRPTGEPVFRATHAWPSPRRTQYVVMGEVEDGPFGPTSVDLVDATTGETVGTLLENVPSSPPAWGPDDGLVALGNERGGARVWRTDTGEVVLDVPDVTAALVAISPDAGTLATFAPGGGVQFRAIEDGRLLDEIDPGAQVPMALEWVGPDVLAVLGSGGVVSFLSTSDRGLAERGPACCTPEEFSFVVADGDPGPYAYYGNFATAVSRIVDLRTGEEATVDMSPYVFDPWAYEARLPTREAVVFKPGGEMLLVDDSGELVRSSTWPVAHWPDDVPRIATVRDADGPGATRLALLGVASGEPREVRTIDLAVVDGLTLDVVEGPVSVDLPEPATYATVRDGGLVAVEYAGDDDTRYEFRSLDGQVVADVVLDTPVGWAALTRDQRYVVWATSRDDTVRVLDTEVGTSTVLPSLGEPDGPTMLSGSRFLLQTSDGQYELWDAEGPTRVGALADPGAYASIEPRVSVDESEVWIVLDDAWTRIPIDPEAWFARACDLAGRSLTQQEWRDFVPGGAPYRDACADAV